MFIWTNRFLFFVILHSTRNCFGIYIYSQNVTAGEVLKVSVMDWNKLQRDKPLGDVSIPISDINAIQEKEYSLVLKGKVSGTIRLTLNYTR